MIVSLWFIFWFSVASIILLAAIDSTQVCFRFADVNQVWSCLEEDVQARIPWLATYLIVGVRFLVGPV